MSPGPKKKGRKDISSQKGNVKQVNPSPNVLSENQGEVKKQNEADLRNDPVPDADGSDMKNGQRRYSKRQIQSNWDRYEERTPTLLADTLRGESFEVLAGYQGGSDSYLKLKEEKEWCNTQDLLGDSHFDADELVESLMCIPLHERLHITEDYFTLEMLQKFKEVAERSCSGKFNTPLSDVKSDMSVFGTFSNSQDKNSETNYISRLIAEKAENIVLSLANCTVKDENPKTVPEVKETPSILTSNDTDEKPVSKQETHDDLDLLLSLSNPDRHPTDAVEEKGSSASIEDWLNELLKK